MQTAKAQIRLCVSTVWSGPSLSTNRITGYYRMYEWRAKARLILCSCTGWWSESAQSAHVRRHFFTWHGPIYKSGFIQTSCIFFFFFFFCIFFFVYVCSPGSWVSVPDNSQWPIYLLQSFVASIICFIKIIYDWFYKHFFFMIFLYVKGRGKQYQRDQFWWYQKALVILIIFCKFQKIKHFQMWFLPNFS